jgi:hypothetical protein
LEQAIAKLVVQALVIESNGLVTKDTFMRKSGAGNPTALDLVTKRPVTELDEGTSRRTFIGFNIAGVDPVSSKVSLNLYVKQLGSNATYAETIFVHSVGNNWTENDLRWSNMPKDYSVEPLAQWGPENIHTDNPNTAGNTRYISFDVTNYVLTQKAAGVSEVSFILGGTNSGSGYIVINSKESANPPTMTAVMAPTIASLMQADLDGISLPESITQAQVLALPQSGAVNGHLISWTSSDTSVIANDGTVTLPQDEEEVILTASITRAGITYTKNFAVTVKRVTADEADCAALTFDTIKGANTLETDIKYPLNLVSAGENGTQITWSTSDAGAIAADGTVTRDALANVKDVTLTAAVGNFSKEFHLRVAGDVYILDDCGGFDRVYAQSSELAIVTESTWRITGITHSSNGRKNQYIVYQAAEGAAFEVATVVNGIGAYRAQFLTSPDNVVYTPFTNVTETATAMPIGEFGGYSQLTYRSTVGLPEGTRYLKIAIPDTDRLWRHYVTGVRVALPQEELTFADLQAENADARTVTGDLDLPGTFGNASVAWQSDSAVITSGGVFARPQTDTPVTLTAVITDGALATVKQYRVIAKAYAERLAVLDKPFVWYISETAKIAGIRQDSAFGGLRNDGSVNKLYASFDAVNLTDAAQDAVLIVAVYNAEGRVINVKYHTVTIPNTTPLPQSVSLDMPLTAEENYVKSRVKAFVWDADALSPLAAEPFDITRNN